MEEKSGGDQARATVQRLEAKERAIEQQAKECEHPDQLIRLLRKRRNILLALVQELKAMAAG